MRQKLTSVVVIAVAAVVVVALVVFGAVRSAGHRERMHGAEGHDHVMPQHTEEHHEHGETHEEMAEHHEALEPSGKLDEGVRLIKMAARQFEFEPKTVVVRQGETVRLEVTSEDVAHGIDIESYGIDRKLEPGTTEVITFTAGKLGRHHFHCSVYCGTGHGDMHGEMVVLETAD